MVLPVIYTFRANFSTAYSGYARVGTAQVGHASDPGSAKIAGAFGAGTFTALPRLLSFGTRHGRDDDTSGMIEGSLRAELDDDDAALDPANTASAYYPNVKLRRLVQLDATLAATGTTYTLGAGYVSAYVAYRSGLRATVAIDATDLTRRLAGWTITLSRPAEPSGARINALLSAVGYPSGARNIDPGTIRVPAVTLTTARPLDHLGNVALAEQGYFFVARDGTPTFHDRWHRLRQTSRATLGAGGLPVRQVYPTFSDRGLYNRAVAARTGGVAQTAQDATSIADNDVSEYTLPGNAADLLPDDSAAADWAIRLVRRHKDAQARIAALDLDPYADETGALWPIVLSVEVGDLFQLSHDVVGTKGITAQYVYVESVVHQATPETHTCTLQLSNASPYAEQYAIVGHATRGKVGTARVA